MRTADKPLLWLHGEVKSPPFSASAPDAIVILAVFSKTTRTTPAQVLESCRRRLSAYESTARRKESKR